MYFVAQTIKTGRKAGKIVIGSVWGDDVPVEELADMWPEFIYFEAELVPPIEMEPTRWWRVLQEDGSLYMETSDEDEARQGLRLMINEDDEDEDDWEPVYGEVVSGRKLQRLYQAAPTRAREWKDET